MTAERGAAREERRDTRGRPRGQRRLLVAAAIVVPLAYSMTLLDRAALDTLLREDGVVETVGAAALLATAIVYLAGFLRSRGAVTSGTDSRLKPVAFLLLAVLFVVGAGEEIAWGQRILGWQTPEALQGANAQGETTLHNLRPVQEGLVTSQRLFALFWIGFAVVVPVAVAASARLRAVLEPRMPIAPLAVAPLFVLNQVVSEIVERTLPPSLYHGAFHLPMATVETRETNFALLFLLTAYLIVDDVSRRSRDDRARGQHAAGQGGARPAVPGARG